MSLVSLQSGGFGLSQPMQAAVTALVEALLGNASNAASTISIYSPNNGSIENMTVGLVSPRTVKVSQLRAITIPDSTGTPGAATQNTPAGKASIVAGQSSVVITNTNCAATAVVQLTAISGDATMKSLRVTAAAGSFTVTGDVACTAAFSFGWTIITT